MSYPYEVHLRNVLQFLVPIFGLIVFLLILLNAYIIGQQNIRQRPSLRIYIHLMLIDFVTVLGGTSLVIHYKYEVALAAKIFGYTNLITFYSSLTLFFCLAIVRILIMSGCFQRQGAKMAMVMISTSWLVTIFIFTLHQMADFPNYNKYPAFSATQSVFILLIGTSTVIMNLYIATFTLVNRINHPHQVSANITAVLLLTSTFLCTVFPFMVNANFLYNYSHNKSCPERNDIGDWFQFMVCTKEGRHETELVFLLMQSLSNLVVMLCQRSSRAVLGRLKERVVSIWRTDSYTDPVPF